MIHYTQREEEQKLYDESLKRVRVRVKCQKEIELKENDYMKQIADQQVVHAEEIKSKETAYKEEIKSIKITTDRQLQSMERKCEKRIVIEQNQSLTVKEKY